MNAVAASLIPIFLLLLTGWATRAWRVIDDAQWQGFERVTYYILFPALIVETLAKADLSSVPLLGMGGALVLSIFAVSGMLLAMRLPLKNRFGVGGPAFTSIFQGATRWNTFVALALAASLHGAKGATLSAVAVASMIPLLNVIAVLVLSRYAAPARLTFSSFIGTLVRNPFIWSCALGLALNMAPRLPGPIMSYAEILGRASLAAGLLVVGSGLDLSRLQRPGMAHLVSSVMKLMVLPLLATGIAKLLGVEGAALAVLVICTSVPTASGAYVLARQMGGDAPLMAEIITVQTLLAMLTMPIALAMLG